MIDFSELLFDAMEAAMAELASTQESIDAANLWELDRIVERAMLALRCPPADAKTDTLSGGECRRVALAKQFNTCGAQPERAGQTKRLKTGASL